MFVCIMFSFRGAKTARNTTENARDLYAVFTQRLAMYGTIHEKPLAFGHTLHIYSLPKIRRQLVFQALSVPGAEQLQKLLPVGP